MRYLFVGIKRFCNLSTKLNKLNGIRKLSTGLNHEYEPSNVMVSMMNLNKIQILNTMSQTIKSPTVKLSEIFTPMNFNNITTIQEPIPLQQDQETFQFDSVLRKRRKKMKKRKLRKRRKREKALKRKIS